MLTGTKTTLFSGAAFLLFGSLASGSPTSDARRSIAGAYKQIDAATMRRDSRTVLSFMTPDYQITIRGKTYSKVDMGRQLNGLFSVAKTIKIKTSIQKFAFTKTKATIVAQESGEVRFLSQRTHKIKTVKSNYIFQEVWAKEKGRWLKQKATVLQQKLTLDGIVIESVVVD